MSGRGALARRQDRAAALDLPFVVQPKGGRRDFWSVAATGHYRIDELIGYALADQAIAYMECDGSPSLLVWVVQDMAAKNRFGPIEITFLSRIAEAAIRNI